MAEENIQNLHPAAGIFLNEVTGDIAAENERLREDASRLLPLLDYKQKVHLSAITNEEPTWTFRHRMEQLRMDGDDGNVPLITIKKQIISTVRLTEGEISGHGDDQSLIIPVSTSKTLLLENIMAFGGGIDLLMENDRLWFPAANRRGFFNTVHSATVDLAEEDDVALITIFVSEHACVRGELQGLSRDEIIEIREGLEKGYFTFTQHMGVAPSQLGENECPIFKPTSIVFELTPRLRETLRLIGKATSSISIASEDDNESPSDWLRRTTIAALGDENVELALKENKVLKLQRDALVGIRDEIMRGEISHPEGTLSFSLDEGRSRTREGRSVWCVDIAGKEYSSMTVASIKLSAFLFLGSESNWSTDNLDWPRVQIVSNDDRPLWAMRIRYTPCVDVLGVFNWRDLDEGATADIEDGFIGKLRAALTNIPFADGTAVPTFPPTFKLRLIEVCFDEEIKHILEMVGLNDV